MDEERIALEFITVYRRYKEQSLRRINKKEGRSTPCKGDERVRRQLKKINR